MPIEQTVGTGSSPTNHEENGALREKLGDITLDSEQVFKIQFSRTFANVYIRYPE